MSLLKYFKLNFLLLIIVLSNISASKLNRIKKKDPDRFSGNIGRANIGSIDKLRNKQGEVINTGSKNMDGTANKFNGANFKPEGKVISVYAPNDGKESSEIVYEKKKKVDNNHEIITTTKVIKTVVHAIKLGRKKMKKSKRKQTDKLIEELENLIKNSNKQ